MKDSEKIRSAIDQGTRQQHKKQRTEHLYFLTWTRLSCKEQARGNDVLVSGSILIEKGEQLAQKLGYTDCKLSGVWLDRFKQRHGIVFKTVSGEAASSKDVDTAEWEATLQTILSDYRPKGIFNADETGLFYKCLPNKSLTFQGESCSGQKAPKERVSILCAANMDGSEKLPLLVIGKFGQPRCFRCIRTLPVTYRHNKKAWISTLFEEWVRKLDRRLLLEGRSVALVLDNCSAHPHVISDLRAITLFFLPPNTTSCLQPCDQGIIKNFKTIYRKQVLRKFISSFDETGSTDAHLKMSLLDALVMSAASWHDVTEATVQNCFRHAGFVKARPTASNPESEAETEAQQVTEPPQIDADMSEVSNLFERFSQLCNVHPQMSVDEFINVDDNIQTSEAISMDDIVSCVQQAGTEEEIVDDEPAVPTVTTKMALQAMEQVRTFVMQQEESAVTAKALQLTLSMENCLQSLSKETKKQSTIDAFFKPMPSK